MGESGRRGAKGAASVLLGGHYTILLSSLLLFSLISPFLTRLFPKAHLLDASQAVVLIAVVYTVIHKGAAFLAALALLILGLAGAIFDFILPGEEFLLVRILVYIAFFAVTTCSILRDVFSYQTITNDHINGALCAYLMAAMMWGTLYVAIELIWPGSFLAGGNLINTAASEGGLAQGAQVLFYFSFVTITTLGYGDITPINNPAASAAVLEAVLGQFYMVVLVARLVGVHVASRARGRK